MQQIYKMRVLRLFLVPLFFAYTGYGAPPDFHFRQFSVGEGLPGENVRTFFQDQNGFLWFGIESEGLCKYDGAQFENFNPTAQDSLAFTSSYIYGLHEDLNGHLWVATEKGLAIFNRRQRVFSHVAETLGRVCLAVYRGGQGVMWVGTSKGLLKFHPQPVPKDQAAETEAVSSPSYGYEAVSDDLTRHLQGFEVTAIFQEHENSLWIGTNAGLFQYLPREKRIRQWQQQTAAGGLSDDEVSAIVQLNERYFLIGTDNGVNLFDRREEHFVRLAFRGCNIFNDGKVGIADLYRDSQGTVWIGTRSYGVLTGKAYLENGKTLPVAVNVPGRVSGISSKYVMKILEDKSGQVWVSTKFGGAFVYDKRIRTFPRYTIRVEEEAGENPNFIISAAQSPDGDIWIGTRDTGLIRYRPRNNQYEKVPLYKGAVHKKENLLRRIECVYVGSGGQLWLGHKGGLSKLDVQSGKHHIYPLPKVQALMEDPDGQLWIGTKEGLFLLSAGAGAQPKRFAASGAAAMLQSDALTIELINLDSRGTVWIGTTDGGLLRYFPKKDSLLHFTHRQKHPESISDNTIRAFLEDRQGRIWIGTKSAGLNLYEEGKGFTHFRKADGLPSNTIFSILEDKDSLLWIVTNHGVSRFDTRAGKFLNFTKYHGLQGNVFERRAALLCRDGRMFMAGNNGFNLFDPAAIQLSSFKAPLAITAVKINGGQYAHDLLDQQELVLPYDHNLVSLEFSSLDFRDPGAIQYAYQLQGIDEEWIFAGNHNSVTYSNLPHGYYVFRCRATNADGEWQEESTRLAITIQRPPWLSGWAFSMYALTGLGVLLLLYKLAAMRAGHVHALRSKETELKQAYTLHQMKLNFFTNISHDLRTPLTLIMAPLEKLLKAKRPEESIQAHIRTAYTSARQLMQLTDQLLYFRKAEQGILRLQAREGDVLSCMQALVPPYYTLAENEQLSFQFQSSEPVLRCWFDAEKLEKIVNNLLINAFKFTPAGGAICLQLSLSERASINDTPAENEGLTTSLGTLAKAEKYLRLVVSDTGIGIHAGELRSVFDRYYQAEPADGGDGIGLELVKSLVMLHRGNLRVTSEPGRGSTFCIVLPATKEAFAPEERLLPDDCLRKTNAPPAVLQRLQPAEEPPVEEDAQGLLPARRHRILIVEDNVRLIDFLKQSFKHDFFIAVATSGEEALQQIERVNPDVVLSDVMMRGMNGLALCRVLKESMATSHIPVVLVTAKVLEEQQIEGFEHGADAYVTKPFDVDVLKARLKSMIRNRECLLQKLRDEQVFEPAKVATNQTDELFLRKILQILESNFTNPDFSIEELAFDLHLSRSQLFRKLKSLTGQTPSEYLYAYRINRALGYLKAGEKTVAEIAYQTGFSSPNSFTKTFTKHVGVSPRKYKVDAFT
ncbi:MAG: response regulator [Bacteroidetes bacterium]|nr:response regulator [Bacteroidota bacterium]